jgi:hypothetical protein
MLDRPPKRRHREGASTLATAPVPDAEGKRQERARREHGIGQFTIEANEYRLIEALIIAGKITEAESADAALVATALSAVVADYVAKVLKSVTS